MSSLMLRYLTLPAIGRYDYRFVFTQRQSRKRRWCDTSTAGTNKYLKLCFLPLLSRWIIVVPVPRYFRSTRCSPCSHYVSFTPILLALYSAWHSRCSPDKQVIWHTYAKKQTESTGLNKIVNTRRSRLIVITVFAWIDPYFAEIWLLYRVSILPILRLRVLRFYALKISRNDATSTIIVTAKADTVRFLKHIAYYRCPIIVALVLR